MYAVENSWSILQQLAGKRVHMFEHFGGFKFLANVLHYECLHLQNELLGTCWVKFHLATKK